MPRHCPGPRVGRRCADRTDYSARLEEVFGADAGDRIAFDPTIDTRGALGTALRQAERDERVRQIVDALHRDHESWLELSDKLQTSYRAEVEQAERDARIRETANVFRFLGRITLGMSYLTSRWAEAKASEAADAAEAAGTS